MKPLCLGLGVFFLIVYLLSVWKVKEGEYPPPEPRQGNGMWASVRSYFTDCFTESRYLWIFGGFTLYQINNLGNQYQFFYQHYDLGIDMDTIGKFKALPSLVLFLVGYSVGLLADKLKPVRLMAPALLLWAAANVLSFYYVHDKWSFLACNALVQFASFIWGVFLTAFTVEVFPREKLGQFCSANTFSSQLVCTLSVALLGMLFDHLKDDRLGYLWSAGFQVLSAFCFFRIYHIWKRRHPDQLLPDESPQ
jgi:MFS family permease